MLQNVLVTKLDLESLQCTDLESLHWVTAMSEQFDAISFNTWQQKKVWTILAESGLCRCTIKLGLLVQARIVYLYKWLTDVKCSDLLSVDET